ncbi:hypothetical protein PB01_08790 [Psychrobacillus glaciei]|uniref:Uncharacterized protein n=1 Tax=Psychrobacillus glaciei TaxID=2283160 RepID=A0A5J6SM98_9BACI|nr:hypothetical protein [Psychrobacillus glaciei]QFF98919.1 hypothetical protein PB01_08790 [Psychrobacillus glaciei]
MINAFHQLYKGRVELEKVRTEEEVRQFIQSELMDEFTHPRARRTIETKYGFAITRIKSSKLSSEEQKCLLDIYKEEYEKLSTGYEV